MLCSRVDFMKARRQHLLSQRKNQLKSHLRIDYCTLTPYSSFMHKLPPINPEKSQIGLDRILSQKQRYQANLSTIIVDIKSNLSYTIPLEHMYGKNTSDRRQDKMFNFKARGSRIGEFAQAEKTRSIIYRRTRDKPLHKTIEKRTKRKDSFSMEPWNTIDEAELTQALKF